MKKRVNCGFQVAVIPKGLRSDRRRGVFKRKSDGNQTCAIELLAAVAGKLLLENEVSSASSNEKETTDLSVYDNYPKKEVNHYDDADLFKAGAINQTCGQKEVVCIPQTDTSNHLGQCLQPESEHHSQGASVVSNSDSLENVVTGHTLGIHVGNDTSSKLVRKRKEEHSHSCLETWEHVTGSGFAKSIEIEEHNSVNVVHTLSGSLPTKSIRFPSSKGYTPVTSSIKHSIFSLGSRDDDDNIFRCNQHSTKVNTYRPIPRLRVNKFLTYKYKKVSPTWKDHKCHNAVRGGMWPVCHHRKNYYDRDKSDIPLKKRKLFGQHSVLMSDKDISDENFFNVSKKSMKKNLNCSTKMEYDANVASSSRKRYKHSFNSKDSRVRLSIKSLRVPEIYIEVPENATVGSLKRKVLEAVTAVISGVQVGVCLRGKKVRDDSRSLLHAGIASTDDLGKLGFELEPKSNGFPLTLGEDTPLALSNVSNHLTRPPVSPSTPSASFVTSDHKHSESNLEVVLASAADKSFSNSELESKAIVPYSGMNATPLTVVSGDHKAQRSELAQRRTRRPFSVAEVEALVESVEIIGTGRWRDVKIRSFDNANHRTYVDLKDKWKTLVHTAQIAPQQRRGQPVPQELLDRVLAAHSYWSQHQDKLIYKHRDAVASMSTEVA